MTRLTKEKCSSEGNTSSYKSMREQGLVAYEDFGKMYEEYRKTENDDYHITGDMLNDFMESFPQLKQAWGNMTPDEKWIFSEGIFYGIMSPVYRAIIEEGRCSGYNSKNTTSKG